MPQHQVTCPVCHGRKGSSSPNRDGSLTFFACAKCGGRGSIWEDDGAAGRPAGIAPQHAIPVNAAYPLVGTWLTEGGYWNITWTGQTYHVDSFGALGKAGEGVVILFDGSAVLVDLKNLMILPGNSAYALNFNGEELRGSVRVLGMQVPIALFRMS